MTRRRGLDQEYARTKDREPGYDPRKGVSECDEGSCDAKGDTAGEPRAVFKLIKPSTDERCHRRAGEVYGEQPPECRRRQRIGWCGEMERHVGKGRNDRKQDAEADDIGRDQIRLRKSPPAHLSVGRGHEVRWLVVLR